MSSPWEGVSEVRRWRVTLAKQRTACPGSRTRNRLQGSRTRRGNSPVGRERGEVARHPRAARASAPAGRCATGRLTRGNSDPPRDLAATTPDGSYCINVYHPRLQETMIEAAEEAGAEVRRGVRVTGVVTGARARRRRHVATDTTRRSTARHGRGFGRTRLTGAPVAGDDAPSRSGVPGGRRCVARGPASTRSIPFTCSAVRASGQGCVVLPVGRRTRTHLFHLQKASAENAVA